MDDQLRDTIDDTLDWLQERRDNCARIAATKSGADRDGWIDDGVRFGHAHSLIRRAYRSHLLRSRPETPDGRV